MFDAQFVNGEITLKECLREQFSLVITSRGDILKELENVVTFRPHFDKLAEYCRTNRLPLTIVSAGLDFVIDHFLKLKGWHKLVETYIPKTKFVANSIQFTFLRLVDETSANFKQDLVR